MTPFIDTERLIHSLKTAIACIIGFALSKLIGFPADQWIIISIIVVMCAQIYVGGVIQKAYLRFIGTIVGCLIAIFTILVVGDSYLAAAISISVSSFIFSYIATISEDMTYTSTLGAVTTAIIMLGQQPTVTFAAERFLEISIGILIATVVSQFILPINARTHLRHAQAETLEQLRDYYTTTMALEEVDTNVEFQDLDEDIVKSLLKQRKLAKESGREVIGQTFNKQHFMQTLHWEKEILRSIDFMHNALISMNKHQALFLQLPALEQFNQQIIDTFNSMVRVVQSPKIKSEHIHLPTLQPVKDAIIQHATLKESDVTYLSGFVFSAETLVNCLACLAALYKIPVYDKKQPESP